MSTRGSFIIRKDHVDKELYIRADAYPEGAGRDAVRLVQSLDLHALYDRLIPEDELYELALESESEANPEEMFTEEPQDFSLRQCIDTVRSGKPYVYEQTGRWFICDSLMCEYGYVLDLDEDSLHFYIGFQKEPQAGNRYGEEAHKGYYPCREIAVFPFAYIRQNETAAIVETMVDLEEHEWAGDDAVRVFAADPAKEAIPGPRSPQAVRQLIIARKDLHMSPGKLAAQVSHASMAFLADMLKRGEVDEELDRDSCEVRAYRIRVEMLPEIYDDWLHGIFTKTICEARNRNQLMKAVALAEELGLQEGRDFFLIRDSCLTELEPEEYDEQGQGRTLTCIGFRPLPDTIAHAISRKYQLYK